MARRKKSQGKGPPPLSIYLIGGRAVYVGDHVAYWFSDSMARPARLLYLLALADGHCLPCSHLCAMLWPDEPPEPASNRLPELKNRILHTLCSAAGLDWTNREERKRAAGYLGLGHAPDGVAHPGGRWLYLCPRAPLAIDVDEFQIACQRPTEPGTVHEHVERFSRAIAWYLGCETAEDVRLGSYHRCAGGQPGCATPQMLALDDIVPHAGDLRRTLYEQFQAVRREYACAMGGYLEQLGREGDLGAMRDALATFERLMAAGPADEEVERADESLRAMVAHLAATNASIGIASAGDKTDRFVRGPVTTRSTLPLARRTFIGRESELQALAEMVLEHPLVVVSGPPGAGKTWLADEFARSWADGRVQEIHRAGMDALAPGVDSTAVSRHVASALQLHDEGWSGSVESIAAAIGEKYVLLLLDNCEHVAGRVAMLSLALLEHCPRLTILATSRTPLGSTEEQVYNLGTLSLPRGDIEDIEAHPEIASQSDAVALFLWHICRRHRTYVPTAHDLALIAQICARLDGLPLAIRLAAVRCEPWMFARFAEQLDSALRLLVPLQDVADAPPRQRTMESAIRWSYDLLSPGAQRLLRRLAVFAGGFSEDAAIQVCGGEAVPANEVSPRLHELERASLLVVERGDLTRFRFHELIRQFAFELLIAPARGNLAAKGEPSAGVLRRRHAEWCIELATREAARLTTRQQLAALRRLDTEYENLHRAIHWTRDHHKTRMALQLAERLRWYYWMRAHYSAGMLVMERALALYDAVPAPSAELRRLAADVMCGAAMLLMEQSKWERAQLLVDRALALHRQLADRRELARSLSVAGRLAYGRADYASALRLLGESLNIREELGDRHGIAIAHKNLGTTEYYREHWPEAEAHLEQSLMLFEELGDATWLGYALINLANVHSKNDSYATADALYLESLAIRWLLGERSGIDSCLAGLIHNAVRAKSYRRAAWIYGVERRLCRDMGLVRPPQDEEPYRQMLETMRQALGPAVEPIVAESEGISLDEALAVLIAGQTTYDAAGASRCALKPQQRDFCQVRLALRRELTLRECKVADASAEGAGVSRVAAAMRLAHKSIHALRADLADNVFALLSTQYAGRLCIDACVLGTGWFRRRGPGRPRKSDERRLATTGDWRRQSSS